MCFQFSSMWFNLIILSNFTTVTNALDLWTEILDQIFLRFWAHLVLDVIVFLLTAVFFKMVFFPLCSVHWWCRVARREVFPAGRAVANSCETLPCRNLWLQQGCVTCWCHSGTFSSTRGIHGWWDQTNKWIFLWKWSIWKPVSLTEMLLVMLLVIFVALAVKGALVCSKQMLSFMLR